MFQKRYFAAAAPRWTALWISPLDTDAGNGNSGSWTMTLRTKDIKRTPRMLPTMISAVDFQYASWGRNEGQAFAIRKAGIVKMAPAAIPSPIEPAVRAMFSSTSDPFHARNTAIAMTAAG